MERSVASSVPVGVCLGRFRVSHRVIRYVVRDLPTILFTEGVVLPPIPQTMEYQEFFREYLKVVVIDVVYIRRSQCVVFTWTSGERLDGFTASTV